MLRRRTLHIACCGVALGACQSPPPARRSPAGPVVWPAPPELPRFVHEASLRNAASVADGSGGAFMRALLTGDDGTQTSFAKPLAVAARQGRVYVTDTEGRRVFVFDLPRRKTFQFGFRREGTLKMPAGIAVDARGTVYVVDSSARRLVMYDALGLYLRHIDGSDWVHPTAVAVQADGQRIYVVDTGRVGSDSHRVFVYGAEGDRRGVIGRRGEAPGEFNLPTDAAVAPDQTLWVLDAGNFRVQGFGPDGAPLRQFGSVGRGLGQLARPRGLAVDAQGLIYVSDANFCNVQVFQPGGELLLALGSRGEEDAPGRYRLPAKLACDERGHVYLVDQFFHKVDVLRRLSDAEGERLRAAARP
jgi:DNA-binding beta-propeller fold protein YncE